MSSFRLKADATCGRVPALSFCLKAEATCGLSWLPASAGRFWESEKGGSGFGGFRLQPEGTR